MHQRHGVDAVDEPADLARSAPPAEAGRLAKALKWRTLREGWSPDSIGRL